MPAGGLQPQRVCAKTGGWGCEVRWTEQRRTACQTLLAGYPSEARGRRMLPSGAFLSVWGELSAPHPIFHAPPLRGVARRKEQGNHPPRGGSKAASSRLCSAPPAGAPCRACLMWGFAPHTPGRGRTPCTPSLSPAARGGQAPPSPPAAGWRQSPALCSQAPAQWLPPTAAPAQARR